MIVLECPTASFRSVEQNNGDEPETSAIASHSTENFKVGIVIINDWLSQLLKLIALCYFVINQIILLKLIASYEELITNFIIKFHS